MASEIRVNQIQSRTGVSTVSFTDTGPVISGVTTVQGSLTVTEGISGNLDVSGTINANSITGDGSSLTGIVAGLFEERASGIVTTSNVGVQTATLDDPDLVGAGNSFVGLYIGDGSLFFSSELNRPGGYYITTSINALNAGPVTLGSTMTLDGTWVIV